MNFQTGNKTSSLIKKGLQFVSQYAKEYKFEKCISEIFRSFAGCICSYSSVSGCVTLYQCAHH